MVVPVTDIPPPCPAIPFGIKDQHEIVAVVPIEPDVPDEPLVPDLPLVPLVPAIATFPKQTVVPKEGVMVLFG